MRIHFARCAAVVLAAGVTGAGAQPVDPVDPMDPAAPVRVQPYRSAFAGYRAFGEQASGSWRSANALTGKIGGWRAYAREIQTPDEAPAPIDRAQTPAPTPDAAAKPPSAPAKHDHNHKH